MNLSLAAKSLVSFGVALLALALLTFFESSLVGLPQAVERPISGLFLVLPGVVGVLFGVMSIVRKEPKRWMAYLGMMLNALFALFHILVLSFAG